MANRIRSGFDGAYEITNISMDKQKRKVIHMLLRNHTREFVGFYSN